MARVVSPLRAMGADIDARQGQRAPLTIRGGPLTGRRLVLEQASGQVKTALTLAGLQADGTTEIVEPAPSRDHTERMLGALGAPVHRVDDRTLVVTRGRPRPFELELAGDPSSAAFLIVAAAVTPGSELVIDDVAAEPGTHRVRRRAAPDGRRHRRRRAGRAPGRAGGQHHGPQPASLHGTTVDVPRGDHRRGAGARRGRPRSRTARRSSGTAPSCG